MCPAAIGDTRVDVTVFDSRVAYCRDESDRP
jgi:hypothetical protein